MADAPDMRENNVSTRQTGPGDPARKRTNNKFKVSDLPPDSELYDEEERREMEEARRQVLSERRAKARQAEGTKVGDADEDELDDSQFAAAGVTDKEGYLEAKKAYFADYEYSMVPRVPMEFRGADILGLRTRATGNTSVPIGPIAPKVKLRTIWDNMTDIERYILMLVSEHRHATTNQLVPLTVLPTIIRHSPGGGCNSIKPYYEWVTKVKYESPLDYKETFKTGTVRGLQSKIDHLCELGVLEEITPSYKVRKCDSPQYSETPSLFTSHYYLTPLGARVLICNTAATVPNPKAPQGIRRSVGYVDTYRNAAYVSIVHEAECNEVFCSLIEGAEYMSNVMLFNKDAEQRVGQDGKPMFDSDGNPVPAIDYGTVDVCRWYHEKDCEFKNIPYHDRQRDKDVTIDFKCDGEMTVFSTALNEFVDMFLEYDSGTSSMQKIQHKVEAFARYVIFNREEHRDRFRLPVLLLVSQQPSAFMPGIKGSEATRYTRGIQAMMASQFSDYDGDMNDLVNVLVADVRMIRQHGAMGAVWHKIDMGTGVAEKTAHDLLTAVRPATRGR